MIGFVRKTLKQIFDEVPVQPLSPLALPDVKITGVVSDSRRVEAGNIFVAFKGKNSNGHDFISQAAANGAAAVVGSEAVSGLKVPYIQVADARHALAHLAAALHDFPARHLTVIGVTGTDGKTTTSNLIYQILTTAGYWTGMVSSVSAMIGGEVLDTGFHVTTPEAPDVQRYLARMVSAGLTHVVLESTSHGLAQHRLTACEYDVGVLTNITHEHLDYHGTFEKYRAAKAILFRTLAETVNKSRGNPRLAVLNRDDQSYDYMDRLVSTPKISYSLRQDRKADLFARDIRHDMGALHFEAVGKDFRLPITCDLVGDYNVSNCLAALAATVIGLGVAPEVVGEGIAALHAIPGRMERIDMGQDFIAIVDFAHTPNALKNALQTVRQMTGGKVIAVFGSAGLRDREKRRMMAEVSVELADTTVLTAEDPRTESLDDILAEMVQAAQTRGGTEGRDFFCISDRGDAIRFALQSARPGDVVVACGKGHEQSMCFGEIEYPWDDRTAMRAGLAELLGLPGESMPYLPTQG